MAERKKTVQSTRRSNSAPKKGNNSRKTTAMPKKETAVPKKGKVGRPRKTDYQKPERIENPGNEGFSVWEEILVWLVLALSVLILIGNFGVGGFIGNTVSHISLGAFGLMAYLFPFALFLGVAFAVVNKEKSIMWVKLGGCCLMWLAMSIFCELINGYDKSRNLMDYYKYSIEEHTGGGIIGGIFCKVFCPSVGIAGAYVIVILLAVIALVLITQRSLFRGMQKSSKKVYCSAKEDARRRMEQARIHREEQALYREQQLMNEREALERRKEAVEEEKKRRLDHKVTGVTYQTVGENLVSEKSEIPREIIEAQPIIEEEPGRREEIYEEEPEESFDFLNMLSIEGLDEEDHSDTEPEPSPCPVPDHAEESGGSTETEKEKNRKNPRSSAKEQKVQLESVSEEIEAAEKVQKPQYAFPPMEILGLPRRGKNGNSSEVLKTTAQKLQNTLHSFGVEAHVTNVSCGPSVTRYELTPEQGVKVSRIVNLADDIKLNLAAEDIRIEAPIPGKAAVGIEVPNKESSEVYLRELLESSEFQEAKSKLSIAVGKDLAGKIVVADIAKMPHLLIAGATGSGKSVCVNTIIMSLIYKASPEDVKLIMIDPKVVELSVYNGIPHLFIPVVTDPKKAAGALNWAVAEMTKRYQQFATQGVRDLKGYNQKIESIPEEQRTEEMKKMPQIVIIVDELADLMMVAPGEVEDAVCRLAQLARAAGIHLILATQRPSVNVITGLIKANMPSRIAFKASSGVDSRTILDMNGAEKLLGKGDMLFYPQNYQKPARLQGAFVKDSEVEQVVEFLTQQNNPETYNAEMQVQLSQVTQAAQDLKNSGSDVDEYFADAGKFIIEKDKASIGMLQRMFKIGFNRAARIMDQLSDAGVVGPEEGTKPRKVLMSMEQFENYLEQGQ